MSNFNDQQMFLGTGWQFPISSDEMTGRVVESSYEENIRQNIYLIVMTKKGERVMRPDFGCDIHKFMFDIMDYTTLIRMRQAVKHALIQWEPRITDIQVEVLDQVQESNSVQIRIAYRVRTTNNPFNMVFPFYLEEH